MTLRHIVGLVFLAAVATGCGGVSDPEYRIEQGGKGTMVVHGDAKAVPLSSGTFEMKDGTTETLSSEEKTASYMADVYICCDTCTIYGDGSIYCTGCQFC